MQEKEERNRVASHLILLLDIQASHITFPKQT